MLRNPKAWSYAISQLEERCKKLEPSLLVGIESRGFIVASSLAIKMGIGFVPIRKKGKLPGQVISINYDLEYGSDTLEIQEGLIDNNKNIILIDDLLATGGTAQAAASLVNKAGGRLAAFAFLIELSELLGRNKLPSNIPIIKLISY